MSIRKRNILLNKLLLRYGHNKRLWPALIALCLGVFLILSSVIIWDSTRDILAGKFDGDSIGSTYLTVNKKIPDENLTKQQQNLFSAAEVNAFRVYPHVKDVGVFVSAQFPVEVLFSNEENSFSTSLFVEAVPKRFIDNDIKSWRWEYGHDVVPVIISKEFLNLYNFGYAPNQGVPQLTEGTILSLDFELIIGRGALKEKFKAKVLGFSNRISSILVPEGFVDYGNQVHGGEYEDLPSRLILEVTDPTAEEIHALFDHGEYETSKELLRLNKLRTTTNYAVAGMALLAILFIAFGVYVFTMFIDLTIVQAETSIKNLILLGYSPFFLSKYLFFRYGLILIATMLSSGLLSIIAQVRIAKYIVVESLIIAKFPSWEVWAALGTITLLLLLLLNRIIVNKVNR